MSDVLSVSVLIYSVVVPLAPVSLSLYKENDVEQSVSSFHARGQKWRRLTAVGSNRLWLVVSSRLGNNTEKLLCHIMIGKQHLYSLCPSAVKRVFVD